MGLAICRQADGTCVAQAIVDEAREILNARRSEDRSRVGRPSGF